MHCTTTTISSTNLTKQMAERYNYIEISGIQVLLAKSIYIKNN